MTYPVDLLDQVRAQHLVQRCRDLDALARLEGMTQGALALVPGHGLYRAEVGPTSSLARASSGRSPWDHHQVQVAGVPRFASPVKVFESVPAGGVGSSFASEGGLLLEPGRTNRCTQAAGAPAGGYNPDAGAGVTGSSVGMVDPIVGSFRRIEKTAGPSPSRFGAFVGGGGLSGPSVVSAALVRPWNDIGRVAIYTDALRAAGLITTNVFVPLADLPLGEWSLIRCVGRVGGSVLSGTFSTYFWLDNGVGGLCDVALVTTTSGAGGLICLESSEANLVTTAADAAILTPSVPLDLASGQVAIRASKSLLHGAVVPTDSYQARVLWQARVGLDGFRLAWESDNQLRLTMTSGPTTTAVSWPFVSVPVGNHSIVARWSRPSGELAVCLGGSVVAQASGIPSAAFPAGVCGQILLGHSGSGAESLQGAVPWVCSWGRDPGASEAIAASAQAEPQASATQTWDFRQGLGVRLLATENRPEVVLSVASGCAWVLEAPAVGTGRAGLLLDALAW